MITPFHDTNNGEPVRLMMPLGGIIGEAWVFGRELTAAEIRRDYEEKKDRYNPAPPGKMVLLREMNSHPATGLWKEPPTAGGWEADRGSYAASPRCSALRRHSAFLSARRFSAKRTWARISGVRCRSRSNPETVCRHTC
jgi:hypothetical protein